MWPLEPTYLSTYLPFYLRDSSDRSDRSDSSGSSDNCKRKKEGKIRFLFYDVFFIIQIVKRKNFKKKTLPKGNIFAQFCNYNFFSFTILVL